MASPISTNRTLRDLLPGLLLSAAVAIAAVLLAPGIARLGLPIPAMVVALLLGMALSGFAGKPHFQPGIGFCVKTLLRWAVALLGVRIALGDVIALGWSTAIIIVVSMAATLASGILFARMFGQDSAFGALSGAGTAICGASATLATSTVLPDYKGKEADVVFVVIAVNALSTGAMILYPVICAALGFDPQTTGIMLGATIHDVAQVVGAGYAVSETAGNNAVIVKLFRVFLLLPAVLVIGFFFSRGASGAKVPVPVFAFGFLALCLINSVMPYVPALAPVYAPVKELLGTVSTWGLLLAIGALGLGTSLAAIRRLGWRHAANIVGTTLVILIVVTAGLVFLR